MVRIFSIPMEQCKYNEGEGRCVQDSRVKVCEPKNCPFV